VTDARLDATLRTAERAAALLAERRVGSVVIGALALAAHDYPRATEDLDLAIAVAPGSLESIASALRAEGWQVDVRMPDGADPLGGVIDVRAPGADVVQIVNFDNAPGGGFPRLVTDAIPRSLALGDTSLRVADLPMLVAFKLYAGGPKSALDVLALLERNDVDLEALRGTCTELGLSRELARVLALRA
jgi:hypothetical protein